jgi:hypothetical protein
MSYTPPKPTDKVVVCAECLQATCWYGLFMCEKSRWCDMKTMTVAELRKLGLEHESYWSDETLIKQFGNAERRFGTIDTMPADERTRESAKNRPPDPDTWRVQNLINEAIAAEHERLLSDAVVERVAIAVHAAKFPDPDHGPKSWELMMELERENGRELARSFLKAAIDTEGK